jgi:hypothetical protein
MRGAILHSPNTPSWRGTRLKNRDNFTFTFKSVGNILFEAIWLGDMYCKVVDMKNKVM